jgi:hypothetical protein
VLLLGADAVAALLFGGPSVAPCLGFVGGTAACVDAWRASLSPFDRFVFDLPQPLPAVLLFLVLVALTVALVAVSDRVRRAVARARAGELRA